MTAFASANSYYLPVESEVVADDLPVDGHIPADLRGLFVRNGPNPRAGAPGHIFFGEGMLHGVWLEGGRAVRYANRWVGPNTNVVRHAGRTLALVEVAPPTEFGADLAPLGVFDFEGALRTAMTAHPKICPQTGEMHFFGSGWKPEFAPLTYHRADASGALVETREIAVPGRTMMHDFALTQGHVVFMDLPVVFDEQRAQQGTAPFRWSDTYGARFGVMLRAGGDVRWFDVAPCYVFHVLNAFEDGTRIVVDAVRYDEIWRESANDFTPGRLHRWIFDLADGSVRETQLDDRTIEFPRADERLTGQRNRYGYALRTESERNSAIVKYDLSTGASSDYELQAWQTAGEAVFVPRETSEGEDAGWLMFYAYNARTGLSDLEIVDASTLQREALIHLPQRVPFGFHGAWFDAGC